ncbi:MAG: hypothetical protein IID14_00115 [Candidatus Marinimicrobia bacterium]|nr:hypothetical protein [Candidatus Neomarinimicrobiota bacterium]
MSTTPFNPPRTETQVAQRAAFRVLWQARKFIVRNFLAASMGAVIVSLLLPVWYRSSTTILSSSVSGGDFFSGGLVGSGALSVLGLGGNSEELNTHITILRSRQVLETIIREFGLLEIYRSNTIEDALETLSGNIDIEVTDEGALVFGVIDRDSVRARDMADAMLRELGSLTSLVSTQAGQRNRRFIHARIMAVEANLAEVEQAFQDFSAKYGVFELPSQLAIIIEQLVQMEVRLAEAEVEYNVALANAMDRQPELDYLRLQRDELSAKLDELAAGKGKTSFLLNLEDLPNISVQYARLTREMTVLSAVLEFLYPQYEQAGLQEAKDEPTYYVLDYPRVPQQKYKPFRSLIVITVGLFSLMASSFWVIGKPQIQDMLELTHDEVDEV